MQVPPNVWPDTPAARGTLFFAQSMKVFLSRDSFEGFRAYSLDTISRLDELVALAKDVAEARVPTDTMSPLLGELVWSLKADTAAQSIAPDEVQLTIELCQKKADVREISEFAYLLRRRLYPRYRDELKLAVVNAVNDPERRTTLLAGTGFLVSHLINDGHDRNFLDERLQQRFFKKEMKRVGASVVKSFIDTISRERKEYFVCFGIDRFAEHALSGKKSWSVKAIDDLPPAVRNSATWSGGSYDRFGVRRQWSSDPYAAASNAEDDYVRIQSFFVLPASNVTPAWSHQCAVYRPRANSVESLQRVDYPLQPRALSASSAFGLLKQTASLQSKMDSSLDTPSINRLNRALATATTATKVHLDEPRLLSLWSSFEVLLSEPDQNDIRILHFIKQIVPAVCIRYHRRVFTAVFRQLSSAYGKAFFDLIWSKALEGRGVAATRFAKLIILPEFDAQRQALLKLCEANPLALNRLFRLENLYARPKSMRETLSGHANRVEWQSHRIYRVRNSLVHAGIAPPYTDTLVWNALDYFRSIVTNIIRVADREPTPSDLDLILSEIALDWAMLLRKLSHSGRHFSDELAHEVFSPL